MINTFIHSRTKKSLLVILKVSITLSYKVMFKCLFITEPLELKGPAISDLFFW